MAASLPAWFKPDYDRALADARLQLGEESFAAAWAEGRAMSVEQAIEYALEEASGPTGVGNPSGAGAGSTAGLTMRERQVATLVGQGLSTQQIAAALGLSSRTVEWYVGSLFGKLGMRSRVQLAAWAARHDLTGPPAHSRT